MGNQTNAEMRICVNYWCNTADRNRTDTTKWNKADALLHKKKHSVWFQCDKTYTFVLDEWRYWADKLINFHSKFHYTIDCASSTCFLLLDKQANKQNICIQLQKCLSTMICHNLNFQLLESGFHSLNSKLTLFYKDRCEFPLIYWLIIKKRAHIRLSEPNPVVTSLNCCRIVTHFWHIIKS